eukprot:1376674-Pleurochrysis_carterae.AAC.1
MRAVSYCQGAAQGMTSAVRCLARTGNSERRWRARARYTNDPSAKRQKRMPNNAKGRAKAFV